MIKIEGHNVDTYWIVRNSDKTIIHHGIVIVNNIVDGGLNIVETFTVRQDWVDRLTELGVALTDEELNE